MPKVGHFAVGVEQNFLGKQAELHSSKFDVSLVELSCKKFAARFKITRRPIKHTLLVGVRMLSIKSLNINGAKKKLRRSTLLITGGASKASCSRLLKIVILGIGISWKMENTGGSSILIACRKFIFSKKLREIGLVKTCCAQRSYAHEAQSNYIAQKTADLSILWNFRAVCLRIPHFARSGPRFGPRAFFALLKNILGLNYFGGCLTAMVLSLFFRHARSLCTI